MIRFLHTSDWQLGMTRHFLDEGAQARFAQDRIDAIKEIGRRAKDHSVDFVVVAGDVFESNQVKPQTVLRALEALGSISVPVFLLPANHDPLDSASVYLSKTFADKKPDTVHVIETSEPIAVRGVDGAEIVGVPWYSKRQLTDAVAQATVSVEPCPSGTFRVMLAHGGIDGGIAEFSPAVDAPGLISLEAAEAAIRAGCVQYLALGDRHSYTDVGKTGAIRYSGTHVATSFRETDPGKVLLVEIADDHGVSVEVLPVNEVKVWRFVDQRFDLSGPDDVEAVKVFLDEQPDKARTIVRLTLAGHLSISSAARLEEILSEFGEHFASVREWDRHMDLTILPDEIDSEDLNLVGYARATWNHLVAAAEDSGDGGKRATDALCLLYRLARSQEADAGGTRETSA